MTNVQKDDYEVIDRPIEENLFNDLKEFVKIRTFRSSSTDEDERQEDEKNVVKNLEEIRRLLFDQTDQFNQKQEKHKLEKFEWKKNIKKSDHWLFGLRLGTGGYKITVCSHLDTVQTDSIKES